MSNGKPSGMLTTGAVGGILWALAIVIMFATGAGMAAIGGGMSAGGARTGGAMMLLAAVLMLAGGITQGVGFFGFKKMYGGLNALAGIFCLLFPIFMILLIVIGIMGVASLALYLSIAMPFVLAAAMLFPGLALLGNKGQTENASWAFMVGGICLAVAGGVLAVLMLLGLLKVNIGGIAVALFYVIMIGGLLGHIMAAIAMLSDKK